VTAAITTDAAAAAAAAAAAVPPPRLLPSPPLSFPSPLRLAPKLPAACRASLTSPVHPGPRPSGGDASCEKKRTSSKGKPRPTTGKGKPRPAEGKGKPRSAEAKGKSHAAEGNGKPSADLGQGKPAVSKAKSKCSEKKGSAVGQTIATADKGNPAASEGKASAGKAKPHPAARGGGFAGSLARGQEISASLVREVFCNGVETKGAVNRTSKTPAK
ncbi:unnamed protein product, partial [Laminaria digitata]